MAVAARHTKRAPLAEGVQGGKGGERAQTAAPACRPLLYDWSQATRGDLRLLARAIRRRWPIPAERRPPLIAAVENALDSPDPRRILAVAWVLIAADEANLETGS
jgi:hypothetical protein